MYIPQPIGVRTVAASLSHREIATEILALTKMNWNQTRLDGRMPVTIRTANQCSAPRSGALPTARAYPWIVRPTSVVNQFYVHCVGADFRAFFLKFSSCFPYGPGCWSTAITMPRPGRQGRIGFTALDNGFAACDDVPALQAICDSLDEDKIEALARNWLAILPNPYSPADLAAGYPYDISVLQAEFSLTQVLDKPASVRGVVDDLVEEDPLVIFVQMWTGMGYAVVIFPAGQQTIPVDLLEAAVVDDAGP